MNEELSKGGKAPLKYVVDSNGRGTHKTVAEAFADAMANPDREAFIQINPTIRLPESADDWSD